MVICNYGPWLLAGTRLSFIHHAGSSKVLSFIVSGMLAIMHADTLHEVARLPISLRHPQQFKEGSSQLQDLAWSHLGAMLAIWLQGPCHVTPDRAAGRWHAGPSLFQKAMRTRLQTAIALSQ